MGFVLGRDAYLSFIFLLKPVYADEVADSYELICWNA